MNARRSQWSSLAAIPAAFLSLLAAVTCPACLGAYASLFSALGLGFLVRNTVPRTATHFDAPPRTRNHHLVHARAP